MFHIEQSQSLPGLKRVMVVPAISCFLIFVVRLHSFVCCTAPRLLSLHTLSGLLRAIHIVYPRIHDAAPFLPSRGNYAISRRSDMSLGAYWFSLPRLTLAVRLLTSSLLHTLTGSELMTRLAIAVDLHFKRLGSTCSLLRTPWVSAEPLSGGKRTLKPGVRIEPISRVQSPESDRNPLFNCSHTNKPTLKDQSVMCDEKRFPVFCSSPTLAYYRTTRSVFAIRPNSKGPAEGE